MRLLGARNHLRGEVTYHEEIEQSFQEFRGTANFRLSTSDWGLISKWQLQQIPVEIVIRGVKEGFKQHEARRKRESVNSLAYLTATVLKEWAEYRKRAA